MPDLAADYLALLVFAMVFTWMSIARFRKYLE